MARLASLSNGHYRILGIGQKTKQFVFRPLSHPSSSENITLFAIFTKNGILLLLTS
jgi:hypothetical protein